MRDPDRIESILYHIFRIWHRHPDMRFGQLVDNLFAYYFVSIGESIPKDYFYVEDDNFYKWLIDFEEW